MKIVESIDFGVLGSNDEMNLAMQHICKMPVPHRGSIHSVFSSQLAKNKKKKKKHMNSNTPPEVSEIRDHE
ncbi:MAG: hypothetical protein GY696_33495 [Gammaproteobacteria bacterium]|nr:hypothetical protein [Gammaproteobacteria bacterium]